VRGAQLGEDQAPSTDKNCHVAQLDRVGRASQYWLMSGTGFYSERLHGAPGKILEDLPESTRQALIADVRWRINGNWLAERYPAFCGDGNGVAGTDEAMLNLRMAALIPGIEWPIHYGDELGDNAVYDVLEFVGESVSEPKNAGWHSFYRHYELEFDRQSGATQFRDEVNRLLARAGMMFEMTAQMQMQRLGPPDARSVVSNLRPATGDATLDMLLTDARRLYTSREMKSRRQSIEKLWDGFERLKTIDDPSDKKRSVGALLDQVADVNVRAELEVEMKHLTDWGNSFEIRHHEVGKKPLPPEAIDYFFTRMGALIIQLLKESGRSEPMSN
jgi:hypothetical protein